MPFTSQAHLTYLDVAKRAQLEAENAPLGVHPKTGDLFYLSERDRYAGMYVVGVQGVGKSGLLENLIAQDCAVGNAVVVIDPHGDLTAHCLAELPQSRVEQTYVLDMEDEAYPFGVNVFSIGTLTSSIQHTQAVERIMHIFEVLWEDVLSQQNLPRYVRAATITLLDNPGATLVDMHAFLLDEAMRLQATPAPTQVEASMMAGVAAGMALTQTETQTQAAARAEVMASPPTPDMRDELGNDQGDKQGEPPPTSAYLAERIADWLRREAILGGGVLLCVTLLAALAGTLASAPQPVNPGTSGPFAQTQQAGPYVVTLNLAPATFGANTFTVTIKDDKSQPVTGVAVLVDTSDTEMDMGTASVQLKPVGADAPGSYQGQGDLTMSGHWQFVVKLLPPGGADLVTTTFLVPVSF